MKGVRGEELDRCFGAGSIEGPSAQATELGLHAPASQGLRLFVYFLKHHHSGSCLQDKREFEVGRLTHPELNS